MRGITALGVLLVAGAAAGFAVAPLYRGLASARRRAEAFGPSRRADPADREVVRLRTAVGRLEAAGRELDEDCDRIERLQRDALRRREARREREEKAPPKGPTFLGILSLPRDEGFGVGELPRAARKLIAPGRPGSAVERNGTLRGAYAFIVKPDSGAASAGVRPGDLVVRLDERRISSFWDMRRHVSDRKPGDVVEVVVWRPLPDGGLRAGAIYRGRAVLGVYREPEEAPPPGGGDGGQPKQTGRPEEF